MAISPAALTWNGNWPPQRHCFGTIATGIRIWGQDVLEFFAGALR